MDFKLLKQIKTRGLFIKMLLTIVVGVLILIVLSKFYRIHITDSYVEVFSLVITVIWFLFALSFMKKNNIHISSFVQVPSKKSFVLETPITLILTYLGGIGMSLIALYLVNRINPSILGDMQSKMRGSSPKLNTSIITAISFAASVIAAPIAEEFIFRGILMNRLHNKFGELKAIIFSSVIFLLAHMTPNPIILFLGLSCAILVYKYKSLLPSILLHVLNNLITFLRDLKSTSSEKTSDLSINTSFLAFGIILLIIYSIYLYMNYKKCRKIES